MRSKRATSKKAKNKHGELAACKAKPNTEGAYLQVLCSKGHLSMIDVDTTILTGCWCGSGTAWMRVVEAGLEPTKLEYVPPRLKPGSAPPKIREMTYRIPSPFKWPIPCY